MSRAKPEDTIVPSEYHTNPTRFYNNLRKLALIVLHNHYNFVRDYDTQEDLVSAAIMKAIDLCINGVFDPTRGNLRTYLYSGMRNEMQNYVYKKSKLVSVDEVYYDQETGHYDNYAASINEDMVYRICDKFDRKGNYHNILIRALKQYGMEGDLVDDLEEVENPDPKIVDAIFCEYVWRAL